MFCSILMDILFFLQSNYFEYSARDTTERNAISACICNSYFCKARWFISCFANSNTLFCFAQNFMNF